MESNKIESVKYVLSLTKGEAYWLATYMQNSLIDRENDYTKEMREKFFNSVKSTLTNIR